MVTKVIPAISNTIKTRQITDSSDVKSETVVDTNVKTTDLFNLNSKQEHSVQLALPSWENVQNDWLSTTPENNNIYWIETNLSEESKLQLEELEENELSLEDFVENK